MGTFASELKAEREKRKIPLHQIASETRISLRHLQSLEEGRFTDLPGGMYNRAFLKAYCEFLRLDFQQVIQKYEAEVSPAPDRPHKTRLHIASNRRSVGISPSVVWGVMLLLSVVGLFFSRRWITAIFSPYFSSTPPAAVRYEPVRPHAAVPHSALSPADAGPAAAQQEPAGAPLVPPAAEPAPTAAPENDTAGMRLEITTTESCWVSITRDGILAFQKVMEAGEIQSFQASDIFQLTFGNAGAVRMKINGKAAGPIGQTGEVVRMVVDRKSLPGILGEAAG